MCVCVINVVQLLQSGGSTQPKLGVKNRALNPQPQGNMEAKSYKTYGPLKEGTISAFKFAWGRVSIREAAFG